MKASVSGWRHIYHVQIMEESPQTINTCHLPTTRSSTPLPWQWETLTQGGRPWTLQVQSACCRRQEGGNNSLPRTVLHQHISHEYWALTQWQDLIVNTWKTLQSPCISWACVSISIIHYTKKTNTHMYIKYTCRNSLYVYIRICSQPIFTATTRYAYVIRFSITTSHTTNGSHVAEQHQ